MKKELTEVYCGSAKGKTTLALGHSLRAAAEGKSVIIIQFLKGKETRSVDFLEQLDDLDIKIFRFEKRDCCYDDLSDEEKAEERSNILNGLNFARKVVVTRKGISFCWMRFLASWNRELFLWKQLQTFSGRKTKVCRLL